MKMFKILALMGLCLFTQDAYAASPMDADTDKDGKISRSEATGNMAKHFDRFDADKDGFISKQELMDVKKNMDNRRKEGRPDRDPMAADTDKDGKISRQEATGNMANSFDRFDTNKDGFIDKEEMQQVRKNRQ